MNRYVINILASRDLSEIAEYFSQNNLEAGEKFFRNLIANVNNQFPFQTVVKATQKYVLIYEDY